MSLGQLRQDFVLEHFKGVGIAKPQRFVGGHCIHHLLTQPAARLALDALNQLTQRLDALLLHQLVETAGNKVLLVLTQQDATGFFQENPELFKIQISLRQIILPL